MDIEGLPEDLQDEYLALKHGAYTIECDVTDALEQAEDLPTFKEVVMTRMQDLINEAQGIIAAFCDEPKAIVLDRNVGSKGERELPASVVEVANPLHEES